MTEYMEATFEPFVTSCSLAVIGMIVTMAFLIFNVYQRQSRIIKMSSPRINVITSLGGLLLNTACFLYGIDSFFSGRYREATIICQSRTWLVSCGATLVFGPMLVKAWRVQRIFNCPGVQRVVITDKRLFAVVLCLLLGDIVLLTMWLLLDPLQSTIVIYSKEVRYSDRSNHTSVLLQKCVSANTSVWMSVILLWKATILVYGLFLSWRIRNVAVPAMNDATSLIVSIFSTMSLTSAAIGFVTLLGDWPNAVSILITLAVFSGNLVAQIMVFAPKVYLWWKMSPDSSFRISAASNNLSNLHSRSVQGIEEDILGIYVDNRNLKECLAEKNNMIKELECLLNSAKEKLSEIPVDVIIKQDSGVDTDVSSSSVQCDLDKNNDNAGDVNLNSEDIKQEKEKNRKTSVTSHISSADGAKTRRTSAASHCSSSDGQKRRKSSASSSSSKRSSKRRSSWKSDLASTSSKLSLLRESIAEDLAHAHVLTSSMRNSIAQDIDVTSRQLSWLLESVRDQQELTRCIAESYDICNDSDTLSYVSGFVSLRSAGSPVEKSRKYHVSPRRLTSSVSVGTLANDKLYPINPLSLNFQDRPCAPNVCDSPMCGHQKTTLVQMSQEKTSRDHTFV